MCKSHMILSQSKNGSLTFCGRRKLFQLVFNNLCFELYEWELEALIAYLQDLDVPYWERQHKDWFHKRQIPISTGQKHLIILVSKPELEELMSLITCNDSNIKFLNHGDIDYRIIEN